MNQIIKPLGERLKNIIRNELHINNSSLSYKFSELDEKQNALLMLTARSEVERVKNLKDISSFSEVEFKVFSQWGQDGIIQYLINRIEIPNKTFVEFGVQDYTESTTRFLLQNNNWSGLIIDGSEEYINKIKNDPIYWKYDLNAVCQFITKDNINDILKTNLTEEDIGLLIVDIDGNDYWIWEAIDVIKPRIVFCEYNSVFGDKHKITVPYKDDFNRSDAHYSNLYFGVSLPALLSLADKKGYDFVGCNSAGNDAIFIRKDLSTHFKKPTIKNGYVQSKFRESRGVNNELTYTVGKERLEIIKDIEVFDIDKKKNILIKDLFKL